MDFSLISQTSLFRGYTPSETEELLRGLRASTRRFVRDSAVYTAGKPVSNIGIVLSGTAQIENNDIWGNTSILGLVKPGEVFAEAYACVPGEPMMVDVVAAEETEVLFLNMDVLVHTPHPDSEWQPVLVQNLLNISLHKNLALSERIFCTAPKTVRGRLLLYLSNQAAKAGSKSFRIPFDRQGLADHLNLDRSALSKELGKMRDEGILETTKNEFTLHELPE